MFNKETGTFKSSNGVNDIKYYVYQPEGAQKPKALLQLVHGMCEYIERYEPYIDFLTSQGYLVFGSDHLGHKGSVKDDSELGFFADEDGWKNLIEDQLTLNRMIREKYSELKCVIYGHSMGSFVTRAYISRYPDTVDAVILSGTAGPNKALPMGEKVIRFVKKLKGKMHHSGLITAIMFGSYNKKYDNPRTAYDWLTRDEAVVDRYIEDKYCGFMFTTSAYLDLVNLLKDVTADSWYERLDPDKSILVISGTMDPVGGWGSGLIEMDASMKKKERRDYTMKLYKDMRHELHNEIGKEQVMEDVKNWINERI